MTLLVIPPGHRVRAHWEAWSLWVGLPRPRPLEDKGCSFQSLPAFTIGIARSCTDPTPAGQLGAEEVCHQERMAQW